MAQEDTQDDIVARSNTYLQRAYALAGSKSAAQDLYDEWARSYDDDLAATGYASPRRGVAALLAHLPKEKSPHVDATAAPFRILDAGCGTGAVGKCLAAATKGEKAIPYVFDGVDLSAGMLSVARSLNLYRSLRAADLTVPGALDPPAEDGGADYDVIICVGTLTHGHIDLDGPRMLAAFVERVRRPGGLVVATVHAGIWDSGGFKAAVERLTDEGQVEVLEDGEFGILEQESAGGRMLVLRRV